VEICPVRWPMASRLVGGEESAAILATGGPREFGQFEINDFLPVQPH
jgi:hypothetical protein